MHSNFFLHAIAALLLFSQNVVGDWRSTDWTDSDTDGWSVSTDGTYQGPAEWNVMELQDVLDTDTEIRGFNADPLRPRAAGWGIITDEEINNQQQRIDRLQGILRRQRTAGDQFEWLGGWAAHDQLVENLNGAMDRAIALEDLRRNATPGRCEPRTGSGRRLRNFFDIPTSKPTSAFSRCTSHIFPRMSSAEKAAKAKACITCVQLNSGCPCKCYDQLKKMYNGDMVDVTGALYDYTSSAWERTNFHSALSFKRGNCP